eukprot:TRINITY_DN6610_c0_g1_i1.p1 TRINITY_DN6610_c0_g1~~TRINITY_DN6610_c0_g1_i1.p1  ORF type:complete len:535 (-),score=163.96 TRINITY_DN6610_c0_g1_i1:100-1704(-)
MNKKGKEDLIGIRETLFDSDYAILRCLLYCAFDDDFQEMSPENTCKDEKTRGSLINFLESNNRICQFIESLLTNLRNPNDKNPNEVLRTDGEDTWFITYYLKKLSMPFMKEVTLPMISLIEKSLNQENLTEERKIEIAIDLCQQFIKSLYKKIDHLPKVFYGVLSVIKKHFINSWKDAIVSLIFLRIIYPAILTSDTYFADTSEKSPTNTPKRSKKTVSEININTKRNINFFLRYFKFVVSNPSLEEEDQTIKAHASKINEMHNSVNEFINKITNAEKYQKKLNKEKKPKNGSKKTQSIVLSLKKHVAKLSKKIDNYASRQSSFKLNINLLIEFLKERNSETPNVNRIKEKGTKVNSAPTLFEQTSTERRRRSDFSFEEKVLIELAPKLLLDNNDKSSPHYAVKKTLRSFKLFGLFRDFLKNEFNSEPMDLYTYILKHKKIKSNEESFRVSSLKFIYSNFVDPNARFCVNAPSDITDKIANILNSDKDLLDNDDEIITKLLNFIYFFLKEPHGRFMMENSKLKPRKVSKSVEDL